MKTNGSLVITNANNAWIMNADGSWNPQYVGPLSTLWSSYDSAFSYVGCTPPWQMGNGPQTISIKPYTPASGSGVCYDRMITSQGYWWHIYPTTSNGPVTAQCGSIATSWSGAPVTADNTTFPYSNLGPNIIWQRNSGVGGDTRVVVNNEYYWIINGGGWQTQGKLGDMNAFLNTVLNVGAITPPTVWAAQSSDCTYNVTPNYSPIPTPTPIATPGTRCSDGFCCQSATLCAHAMMPLLSQMDGVSGWVNPNTGQGPNAKAIGFDSSQYVPFLNYVQQQEGVQLTQAPYGCYNVSSAMILKTYASETSDFYGTTSFQTLIYGSYSTEGTQTIDPSFMSSGNVSDFMYNVFKLNGVIFTSASNATVASASGITTLRLAMADNPNPVVFSPISYLPTVADYRATMPLIWFSAGNNGYDHMMAIAGVDGGDFIVYDPQGYVYNITVNGYGALVYDTAGIETGIADVNQGGFIPSQGGTVSIEGVTSYSITNYVPISSQLSNGSYSAPILWR